MRVKCITCFELILPSESLLSLPCGHVFHTPCILQWFENKKNCPQCRHPSNEKNARRIYLSEMDDEVVDPDDLQKKLEVAEIQLRTIKNEKNDLAARIEESKNLLSDLRNEVRNADKTKREVEEKNKSYKMQISRLRQDTESLIHYKEDAEKTKAKLEKFELIEKALTKSAGEVNLILHERGCFDHRSRELATLVVELKKKLVDVKMQKMSSEKKLDNATASCDELKRKITAFRIQMEGLDKLRNDLKESEECIKMLYDERDTLKDQISEQNRTIERLQKTSSPTERLECSVSEEEQRLPVLPDSPTPPYKSTGLKVGAKRKPLSEVGHGSKRFKTLPNLMEVGVQRKPGQIYDGFGGNSKPDVFPEPIRKVAKKPGPKKNSLLLARERQQQVIENFFNFQDC